MRILGIDPGYATIGFGIIDKNGNTLSYVSHGTITTPKELPIAARLLIIDEKIRALIDEHKPDEVVVEELFFNTNVTTGIKVAEARGVILIAAIKCCGKLYEYTPLQIKQSITGSGNADKTQIQFMVQAILKLKSRLTQDDAADALAAAICHANTAAYGRRELN